MRADQDQPVRLAEAGTGVVMDADGVAQASLGVGQSLLLQIGGGEDAVFVAGRCWVGLRSIWLNDRKLGLRLPGGRKSLMAQCE